MTKYVVVFANNTDYELSVLGPYDTKKEARAVLKDNFRDYPAKEGEWRRKPDERSYMDDQTDDLFYGAVKPIKI